MKRLFDTGGCVGTAKEPVSSKWELMMELRNPSWVVTVAAFVRPKSC